MNRNTRKSPNERSTVGKQPCLPRERSTAGTSGPPKSLASKKRARTGGFGQLHHSLLPLGIVAIVLLATIDDRHVGRATDERQLLRTAVALAETGQLGQARYQDFTYITAGGQAVSRFGLGMSLLQVPAAILAPAVEGVLGAASSQPIFLVVPLMLVLLSAASAGAATRYLGGSRSEIRTAIVLSALGSPLGWYAATSFSETLQAASLVGAYALALASAASKTTTTARRWAFLGGFTASWAILAKSSLIVVAPFALLPLLATSPQSTRIDRVRSALLGFFPGTATWAVFEFLRFGRLFGAYPGENFGHPFWDGLWRLTVGPNLGLTLFFPSLIVAASVLGAHIARRSWNHAVNTGAAVLPFLILLSQAAGWWAWHGVWGWGPRLLVPALPALAACAAIGMARWAPWLQRGFVLVSILVNIPGLVQHPVPVAAYAMSLKWPAAPVATARSLATYAWRQDPDGSYRISPDQVLSRTPRSSQFVVFPWFFWASLPTDPRVAANRLEKPPWCEVRPDLVPAEDPMGDALVRKITGYPRWRFWGRGFHPSADDVRYAAAYDEALADQVIRLQQTHQSAEALLLAQQLVRVAPYGWNDALVFESYRLMNDRVAAREYLSSLPKSRRSYPAINVVLALFERDAGNAATAKEFLASVADAYPPDAPLRWALNQSPDKWPIGLPEMLARPILPAGK
jgi:hypothetical protein